MRIGNVMFAALAFAACAVGPVAAAESSSGHAGKGKTQLKYDPLTEMEATKPEILDETVRAVERYVVITADGRLVLDVPAHVADGLDPECYAALQTAADQYNEWLASLVLADPGTVTTQSIPRIIIEFVRRYWRQIVDIAKRSGKWAWYKAHRCAAGATNALWRTYGHDPALIAQDIRAAIVVAGVGCVANL
jgi:hypothetical protein